MNNRRKYVEARRSANRALKNNLKHPEPDSVTLKNCDGRNKFESREFGGVEHGKIYKKTGKPRFSSIPDYAIGYYI